MTQSILCGLKNFVKITLMSQQFPENAFWGVFPQKLKTATKNSGKRSNPLLFGKNRLPCHFGQLDSCIKIENAHIFETVRDRAISIKGSTHRVLTVIRHFGAKIIFPPFLVAILNFCIKHEHIFIPETDRAKYGRKMIFSKKWRMTLCIPCGPEISLKSLSYTIF